MRLDHGNKQTLGSAGRNHPWCILDHRNITMIYNTQITIVFMGFINQLTSLGVYKPHIVGIFLLPQQFHGDVLEIWPKTVRHLRTHHVSLTRPSRLSGYKSFWDILISLGRGLLRPFLVLFRSSRKCRNIILIYWTLVDIVPPCPAILLRDMARIGVGLAEGDVLEFSESEIYHLLKHLETLRKIRNFHKFPRSPCSKSKLGSGFSSP